MVPSGLEVSCTKVDGTEVFRTEIYLNVIFFLN